MELEKRGKNYRARKQVNGQMIRITFDHKPTKKEVERAFSSYQKKSVCTSRLTFKETALDYIEAKRNILSPSTIKEYERLTNHTISDSFNALLVKNIRQRDVQKEINELCMARQGKQRSPKTIRNIHGFIASVIAFSGNDIRLSTTLPQKEKKEPYIPTKEEVQKVVQYCVGTEYEVAVKLACLGLRRSEICALTLSDLDGDLLTINKGKVLNSNNDCVIKVTKTTESTRVIAIPSELADLIRDQGYIYKGNMNSISRFMKSAQKKLGIQEFSIHKLRHYFASSLSGVIPDEDIMLLGGWSSDSVMKTVYRHALQAKQNNTKRSVANTIEKNLF